MGMHINPEDKTLFTTQYQDSYLKYAENEYFPKHSCVPVIEPESIPTNNLFPSAKA